MQDIFVIDAYRTPFGSFGGSLADVPAPRLAAPVLSRLLETSGLKGEDVDQFIAGQVLAGGAGIYADAARERAEKTQNEALLSQSKFLTDFAKQHSQ